ncbi:MAG: TraB/GumN family protein [Zhaonellaceae bacterium]|jgi:pheromone shutdown-related protein TraB|nr:TraB/GumN family protein [Clostridia bacterium]
MSIDRIKYDDKEIIIVGTAHVSRKSAEEVKEIIEGEKPDSVCIELCDSRYQSLTNRDKWKKMDIIKVIKEQKATLLLVNLLLSSFQGRIAQQLDIKAGQEMIQGIASAREIGARLVMADRDIRTTFLRIWRSLSFIGKMKLIWVIMISLLNDKEISEEELEKLKTEDILMTVLNDFSTTFPELKRVLIDERDIYLAQKIKDAPGQKVVAIVGAGHVPGIRENINKKHDLSKSLTVPPVSKAVKAIGWALPMLISVFIGSTFFIDTSTGLSQVGAWVLWTGLLAALGTFLAMGHPLSILTAFVAAPFTTLHPLLAAGWFAGLCEAYIRRPNVEDLENLSQDIFTLKGFWSNRVTHILLVVAIANMGASLGTFIGGIDIIRKLVGLIGK